MKSSSNNNQLDNFLKDALKTPDANLLPVDWSEVEVLLRHEQKSILNRVSKKTILISVAAVVIVMAALGIIHIVQYYSALPAENKTWIDSTQSAFPIMDTHPANAMESITSKIDTLKIDSSFLPADLAPPERLAESRASAQASLVGNKHTKDFAKSITPSDTTYLKKTSNVQIATKKDSVQHHSMDTVSTGAGQEIKNETPDPVDTTVKNLSPFRNTSKNKKSKSKKQP